MSLETTIALVSEARALYERITQVRPELLEGDYFRAHMRVSDLRGRAYRRLRRRLRVVPVIGMEIQHLEHRHERTIESYQSSFRSLWEHPEFNQGMHSWVEDMF